MTEFTPSAAQAAAIAEVRDWFENRTEQQQVFRLFGYAGSGKSTVLKFALDELGLSGASVADILDRATVINGHTHLNLGNGNSVILFNVANINDLADDLVFV